MTNKKTSAKPAVKKHESKDWKEEYFKLKDQYTARIVEKEKYIRACEEDCDAKLANRDLIIDSLHRDIERLNKVIEEQKQKIASFNRWGLFWRLFGRKN